MEIIASLKHTFLTDTIPTVKVQQSPNSNQHFAGHDVILSCFIKVDNSTDEVTVAATWFKGGIEYNNWDSRISVTPISLNGDGVYMTSLHFMPLSSEDSGYYQCTATATGPTGYSIANATNSTTIVVEGT